MNATKGYYCLVQYCPDVARQEAANVGVVLFSPDARFLKAKLTRGNERIRRFFGEEADGYKHLNGMKDALANRIEIERGEFRTLQDLQTFIAARANKVVLTDPKPVKVLNPEDDLEALHRELVLAEKPLSLQAELPLRTRLDAALADENVRAFLRTNIQVRVPALHEKLTIPYGYQNGRFNLIQPISFPQQAARVKNAACKTAMEGLSLYGHPDPELGQLQLVVVAAFTDSCPETIAVVRDIFHEGSVQLYTPDTLDALKHDILTHGKPPPVLNLS